MIRKILRFIDELRFSAPLSRMEAKSRKLIMEGAKVAMVLHHDKAARQALCYESVTEDEQNRYFNEYMVTFIVLNMLLLDQRLNETEEGLRKDYLRALREEIPKFYGEYLERHGVAKKNLATWDQLTSRRYEEYMQEMVSWRRELSQVSDEQAQTVAGDNYLLIFQALCLGLFQHLKRGKGEPRDPFYIKIQFNILPYFKWLMKKI